MAVAAVAVAVPLIVASQRDLSHRDGDAVRGPKALWRLLCLTAPGRSRTSRSGGGAADALRPRRAAATAGDRDQLVDSRNRRVRHAPATCPADDHVLAGACPVRRARRPTARSPYNVVADDNIGPARQRVHRPGLRQQASRSASTRCGSRRTTTGSTFDDSERGRRLPPTTDWYAGRQRQLVQRAQPLHVVRTSSRARRRSDVRGARADGLARSCPRPVASRPTRAVVQGADPAAAGTATAVDGSRDPDRAARTAADQAGLHGEHRRHAPVAVRARLLRRLRARRRRRDDRPGRRGGRGARRGQGARRAGEHAAGDGRPEGRHGRQGRHRRHRCGRARPAPRGRPALAPSAAALTKRVSTLEAKNRKLAKQLASLQKAVRKLANAEVTARGGGAADRRVRQDAAPDAPPPQSPSPSPSP